LFGPCIIHILYTGCAKIKKNNSGSKRLILKHSSCSNCVSTGFYTKSDGQTKIKIMQI